MTKEEKIINSLLDILERLTNHAATFPGPAMSNAERYDFTRERLVLVDQARRLIKAYSATTHRPQNLKEFFDLLRGAPQTVKIPALLAGGIIYPHVNTHHIRDVVISMNFHEDYSPYDTITIDENGEWWLENLT